MGAASNATYLGLDLSTQQVKSLKILWYPTVPYGKLCFTRRTSRGSLRWVIFDVWTHFPVMQEGLTNCRWHSNAVETCHRFPPAIYFYLRFFRALSASLTTRELAVWSYDAYGQEVLISWPAQYFILFGSNDARSPIPSRSSRCAGARLRAIIWMHETLVRIDTISCLIL